MRLNIYDQFIIGVVRPSGGWSKGRPIAFIEDADKCVPLVDLLLPNDLDEDGIARYVGEKFSAFCQAGKSIAVLPRHAAGQDQGGVGSVRARYPGAARRGGVALSR
jgi:hypothetical protein